MTVPQHLRTARRPITLLRSAFSRKVPQRRFESHSPNPLNSSNSSSTKAKTSEASTRTRAEKVINRLPRFLRRYVVGLKDAPVTHVVSFLVLHEITAVVPLIGLATYFHYSRWLPPYISEGKYISDGIEKFGNYFRRKGWFGFNTDSEGDGKGGKRAAVWNFSEGGSRILVEVATAYAITKAILPARLLLSVWGTPWFARVVIGRLGGTVKRIFGRKKSPAPAAGPAAGTGASGTGNSAVVKGAPKP